MDRKATDGIFGPVLARSEGALRPDDPSFQGAISPEPLTQLEVVAQARQISDADGHEPAASAADAVAGAGGDRADDAASSADAGDADHRREPAPDVGWRGRHVHGGAPRRRGRGRESGSASNWSSSSSRSSPRSISARRCWSRRRSAPGTRSVPTGWPARPSSGGSSWRFPSRSACSSRPRRSSVSLAPRPT